MALTSASDIAAAAWHRAAAGVRTVRRAVVRRSDAWLYGLDQEYPEYDAYHRRPRRIARVAGVTARAGKSAAAVTITLCGTLADRWRQRPSSDTGSAIRRRGLAAPVRRAHLNDRAGRAHRAHRAHRVHLGDGDSAPRTHLPNSRRSDVSDPPGLVDEPNPVHVEGALAVPPAVDGAVTSATTPDARHTSAIPSTFAPGAA